MRLTPATVAALKKGSPKTWKNAGSRSSLKEPVLNMNLQFRVENARNAEESELQELVRTLQTLSSLMANSLRVRGVLLPQTVLSSSVSNNKLDLRICISFSQKITGVLGNINKGIPTGQPSTDLPTPSANESQTSGARLELPLNPPPPVGVVNQGGDLAL